MMHIDYQGKDTYTVNNSELPVTQTRIDLGVIVDQNLKTAPHGREIAFKGSRTLWLVRRQSSSADTETFLTFHTVL